MIEIKYGNHEGQYFTEWRFDVLKDLLNLIIEGPREGLNIVGISDIELWYDQSEDFHRLAFVYNGHKVGIRFYKVLSYAIDGTDQWVGCPRSKIWEFAIDIRKKLLHENNT